MTTGGIISPADNILGEGNGGDINPLEYFKKTSLSSGTQEGDITLKPLFLNSEVFPEEFTPYDILITAGGVAIVAGQDSVTVTTKIRSYKIQKLENSIEFVDELDLEDNLDLQNDYTVLIKVGNFCYMKGFQGNDKIAKIYVSDFGNMEKISVFYDPLYTKFSSMVYYKGYLIVSRLDSAAGDPKIYIIDTAENMSFVREVLPVNKSDFDSIIHMDMSNNNIMCMSNKSGNIKSLIIIDATNIIESIQFDVISKTDFTVTNGVVRAMYMHDETVYAIGVGECQIIGIASKKNPILYGSPFLTNTSITYGVTILGDYALFISWNFDNIVVFNIKDFYNPQQVDIPVISAIYLNAVVRIRSYGPYVLTISQAASTTKSLTAWHNNGYSVPSIKSGTGLFLGKTYFNDQIQVSQKAVFESEIIGKNAYFLNVTGHNLPKSTLTVRSLEDLPPVKHIEKLGKQSIGSTTITDIDTSGLTPFTTIMAPGLPDNTYIISVGASSIEISQPASANQTLIHLIDSHIDLEEVKDREIQFDTNDNFINPYYLKLPTTGSIALNTLGATRYIYSGFVGGAIRGTMSPDTFLAILAKFFTGQLYPMAQFFDINGSPEATVFTENMVTFATPSAHFAVGRIDDVNITNQVTQFKGWSTGLASNNPKKLKPSKWSFRDGYIGHTMDVACFYFTGILDNMADLVGNDFTPNDSRQYFMYIQPSMAAAAAEGGTEFVLRGCNMYGPKNQYWFPNSATGSDIGVDVRGCQPLSNSRSFYFAGVSLASTSLPTSRAVRINYAPLSLIENIPVERFVFNPLTSEMEYNAIQDEVHDLKTKAIVTLGSTSDVVFVFCKGNKDIYINTFQQYAGDTFQLSTNKPNGFNVGDFLLFEGTSEDNWNNRFEIVNIDTPEFFRVVNTAVGGQVPPIWAGMVISRELPHTKRTFNLTASQSEILIEGKSLLTRKDFIILEGLVTTGKTLTLYAGTTLEAEKR